MLSEIYAERPDNHTIASARKVRQTASQTVRHAFANGNAATSASVVQVVHALLAAGAPWNAVDRSGKCAGDLALEAGHKDAAEAILEAGKAGTWGV